MPEEFHPKILDQTLGEVLKNNSQAQSIVMNSMQLTPEQFQQFLNQAGNNQMMNMKIGDMFKNGVFQQAAAMGQGMPMMSQGIPMMATGQAVQITKEQYQQLMESIKNGQPVPLSQLPVQAFPGIPGMNPQTSLPIHGISVQQTDNGQVVLQNPATTPPQTPKLSLWQKIKNLF